MSTATAEPEAVAPSSDRHYGFSVLVSGFARMWRATASALVVLVVNAVGQGLLTMPRTSVGFSLEFISLLLLSAVLLLVTYAVLSAGAFESAAGRAGFGTTWARALRNLGRFTAWVVLQWFVILVLSMFWTVPGWIGAAVLVYIPIAAVDDGSSVLKDSFSAIAAHPFRWLVTVIIIAIISFFLWLIAALNTFFVGGFLASATMCFVAGLLAWWWLTAWACLYRSRPTPPAE